MISLTASLTVSAAAAAVATAPLVVLQPGTAWALLPLLAVVFAVISYRGSLRAASDHGVLFATTFDLHRFDMIRRCTSHFRRRSPRNGRCTES